MQRHHADNSIFARQTDHFPVTHRPRELGQSHLLVSGRSFGSNRLSLTQTNEDTMQVPGILDAQVVFVLALLTLLLYGQKIS